MSINHLENLLANASSTAIWWKGNQRVIKKAIRNKNTMWLASGCAMLASVVAGGALTLHITTQFAPIESFGGVVGSFLGCICMAPLLVSVDVWRTKMWNKWPNNCAPPSSELKLKLFHRNHVIGAHQKKDILKQIAHHPNLHVQKHIVELPALQYLELPDAWWEAVENALSAIPHSEATCAVKSAQQQLTEVYVDIELQSQKTTAPKILKV